MSEIVKDEPVKPMDRAVWNVEHVIKFSKSKHLRYHGHDVSFIDYYGTIDRDSNCPLGSFSMVLLSSYR